MSYANQPNQNPANNMTKRAGGGGLFFILLIVGGFILLSSMNSGQRGNDSGIDAQNRSGVEKGNVSGLEPESNKKRMPTAGRDMAADGWDMNGVEDRNPRAKTQTSGNKTTGDWEMDGVNQKKDDTGVRLNNESKKNDNGAWEMEGVKEKSKKTTKGDWELEGVDK